jgi:hypothetical protein
MKKLLTFFLLLVQISVYAQSVGTQSCKVEIYLLKKITGDSSAIKGLRGEFHAELSDLQDTAFIKDAEILSYSVAKDAHQGSVHVIKVGKQVVDRVNNVGLPLSSGRQFAIVVNGQIAYTGYFWNFISSFGCNWVTAFAQTDVIWLVRKLPDYEFKPGDYDPRQNVLLFDCLRSTNRFIQK